MSEYARSQCSNDASDFKCNHGRIGQKKQRKQLLYASWWCQMVLCLWPQNERFAAIYLVVADKVGISAEQLSKMIGVALSVAYRMLRNLHQSRWHSTACNDLTRFSSWTIPLLVVTSQARKCAGKKLVIFAVEHPKNRMVMKPRPSCSEKWMIQNFISSSATTRAFWRD